MPRKPTGRPNGRPRKNLDKQMQHLGLDLEVAHNKDEWHQLFDLVNVYEEQGRHDLVLQTESKIMQLFGENDFQDSNDLHKEPLQKLARALRKAAVLRDSKRVTKAHIELLAEFRDKSLGTGMPKWVTENLKPITRRVFTKIFDEKKHEPVTEDEIRFLEHLALMSKYKSEGEFMLAEAKAEAARLIKPVKNFIVGADEDDIASLAMQKLLTAGTYDLTAPEGQKVALIRAAVKSARADILKKLKDEQKNVSFDDEDAA